MLRFSSYLLRGKKAYDALGLVSRGCSSLPTVKVLSTDDDEFLKISFRYGTLKHQQVINLKASKEQHIKDSLNQIKLMVNLYKHRSKLRQVIIDKYSSEDKALKVEEEVEEDELFEVNLLSTGCPDVSELRNRDAWTSGSLLKIGESVYRVDHNLPTVLQLNLPNYIIAGYTLRGHIVLECAAFEDCQFTWYRSSDEEEWIKVGEDFYYTTSLEDIGCKLKLVCLPKTGDLIGTSFTTISPNVVEAGPDLIPFQERHNYTKELVDSDCFRCMSYNVLANCYVERKKFPYCSNKAKDVYYRKQLLINEILGYNCDIICLQEVQERVYELDLFPFLGKYDFGSFYARKGGRRYEGIATFFRKSKFRVVKHRELLLNQIVKDKEIFNDLLLKVSGNYKVMSDMLAQDTALNIVLLEHIDNPQYRVLVANTHLYSNKDKPEVRLIQSALCTYYIEHFLRTYKDDNCHTSIVFCGDFNSLPQSAAHEFLLNGTHKCSSSWKNNTVTEDSDMTLRNNLNFKSAYGCPQFTNYTEEFQGCLDYIFYNKDFLNVLDTVPIPSIDVVSRDVALPNEVFPSDHIALVCTLKWNHWKN